MIYRDEKKEFPTDWLNLVRFLAVFYVLWTHFEYEVFAKVNASGNNLEKLYFFPPARSSWLLYGYTGKYAVAMLCVISGFVTAKAIKRKENQLFIRYLTKRYLRLMLSVQGISVFTLVIMLFTGEREYTVLEILKGLFWPGETVFYGHFWCLSSFLIGNCMVYLFCKSLSGIQSGYRVAVTAILLICSTLILYKVYLPTFVWAIIVVYGYLLYEVCEYIDFSFSPVVYVLLMAIAWWLPRGEESVKVYIRDGIASGVILYLLVHMECMIKKLNLFCKKEKIAKLFKYSYALYVVHGFSELFFSRELVGFLFKLTGYWGITYVIGFVLKTIFDFIFAIIMYQIFERCLYKRCCEVLRL